MMRDAFYQRPRTFELLTLDEAQAVANDHGPLTFQRLIPTSFDRYTHMHPSDPDDLHQPCEVVP